MKNDPSAWIERLSSLYRSQQRKAAAEEGVPLVHLEILHFLKIANRFSNTAHGMCEYLGQTKGSISQSLKLVESAGHIERRPCEEDGRVQRIYITSDGEACYRRLEKNLLEVSTGDDKAVETLKSLLQRLQEKNNLGGFGQCLTCRHNRTMGNGEFFCDLMNISLSPADVEKLCREHEFSDQIRPAGQKEKIARQV